MMALPSPTALLALDTSSEYCSVALAVVPEGAQALQGKLTNAVEQTASDGVPIGATAQFFSRHEAVGPQSGARILPAVQAVLDEADLLLSSCGAIAVGAGPGAFTGLRTATSVAQGLAFGLNVPVIPVCTLMACAQAARAKDATIQRVLATIDARMDEVYWALFEWESNQGKWSVVVPPSLGKPEQVPVPQAPFALVGRAVQIFGARLPACAAAYKVDADAHPQAVHIAVLGLAYWRSGNYVQAHEALPVYVRNQVVRP